MSNQNCTLEELINFTSKMDLWESKIRQLLITDDQFDSNRYFKSIEDLLFEHKLNICSIKFPYRESVFNNNKLEHPV